MKTATFADGDGTEIIIYSYYDFLRKFHYTYFIYFPEGCTEFDDDFQQSFFLDCFYGWIIKSKSKAARDNNEECGRRNRLHNFSLLCVFAQTLVVNLFFRGPESKNQPFYDPFSKIYLAYNLAIAFESPSTEFYRLSCGIQILMFEKRSCLLMWRWMNIFQWGKDNIMIL